MTMKYVPCSSLEDVEVVSFDEEAEKVISRLVEGPEESLDVIPIVGMLGLGKTTLARKIFNDPRVVEEYQNDNVDALAEIICDFISKQGRSLIVLDDVWVSEVVDVRVFGKRNCPVELVELGEKIAESCNRVPHAVVVIAGALRGRTNKHDWERVLKIDWQRDNHEIQAHHISS
ncbi:hypothetical protein HAX54_018954 [Datura stramonium]|uniref:NB-ARC domain-containing protein n=1 Tax=Datura stramonium TaxID=4076 RepID=A0ABS8UR06_DATST|nr:hypothetical protein [Datura stramonium]